MGVSEVLCANIVAKSQIGTYNGKLEEVLAKGYNRGFGVIRHNSPKVAANDLYTYESKLFLRTIDNF